MAYAYNRWQRLWGLMIDDNLGIMEDNNCKWADSAAWTCSSFFDDELPM